MKCMAYFILDFIVFMVQSNLFLWRLVWLIHSLSVGSVLTLLLTCCTPKNCFLTLMKNEVHVYY